jgi:tRNA G18 (ribose-2'-O)-methylase SpoU
LNDRGDPAATGSHVARIAAPGPRLLLFALQSPIKVGMILRVAETYCCPVSIFDPHGILDNAERRKVVSDFACGALQRVPPAVFRGAEELGALYRHGRLIATAIEPDAVPLTDFTWQDADVVALGNEYDGLPRETVRAAAVRLRIPMPAVYTPKPPSWHPIDPARRTPVAHDGMPNLNVAVAAGILAYAAYIRRTAVLPEPGSARHQ